MSEWKDCVLANVCHYVKDRRPTDGLTVDNYISTENLLPNKGGYTTASSVPEGVQVTDFCKGDVLVSNIRPYFKKIWQATFDSGCSNDVLVFRAEDGVDPRWLNYVLANDRFFDHCMAGAKGCKMPRGDKQQIMEYPVNLPDLPTQRKIAAVLGALDDKIELNRKMNANLETMAQVLFKSWFVDFEPFGGAMPEGWKAKPLSELADFAGGYSYTSSELRPSVCAMATIKNFERNGGFKLDGYKEIVPSDKLKTSHYVELFDILVAHTDLTQNAEVIGNVEMVLSKAGYESLIMSTDLVKVIPRKGVSRFILAGLLKYVGFKGHALGYVNGTTVLHMSKKALPEYVLQWPANVDVLKPLADCAEAIYQKIALNHESNRTLFQLRDSLLPKLMSGELDVEAVKVW